MTEFAKGERPEPTSWDIVRERTSKILDDTGRIDFSKLTERQRAGLATITVRTLQGEEARAPDITDPTVDPLPQRPHHLLEDDIDFLRGKNNFHTGFRSKVHIYDPFEYMPYWHRFKIIAPELFEWLETIETQRDQHTDRTPEHIEALRIAYMIASQLVCRDDPNLYNRHPNDTLAM